MCVCVSVSHSCIRPCRQASQLMRCSLTSLYSQRQLFLSFSGPCKVHPLWNELLWGEEFESHTGGCTPKVRFQIDAIHSEIQVQITDCVKDIPPTEQKWSQNILDMGTPIVCCWCHLEPEVKPQYRGPAIMLCSHQEQIELLVRCYYIESQCKCANRRRIYNTQSPVYHVIFESQTMMLFLALTMCFIA